MTDLVVAGADHLDVFGKLRRCPSCRGVLTAGEPCPVCGTVQGPPPAEWSKLLKMWTCWQAMRSKFQPWRSQDATWVHVMADGIRMAGGQHANPFGPHITNSTPIVELHAIAHEQSIRWRAAGYPTDPALVVLPAPSPEVAHAHE